MELESNSKKNGDCLEFDEQFFTDEIQGHIDHPHFLQRALWIQSIIPTDSIPVILGCGFGWIVKHLRELGINAIGVDVSQYAYDNRVTEYFWHESAETVELENEWVFSWNMLDCLDSEKALAVSNNLKNIEHQYHVLCCEGDYIGYYIQSKRYWEELFPHAIIVEYYRPVSDLHIPTSWGKVSE